MSFPLHLVPNPHPFDSSLTPIFVPTSAHILAIESYFGLQGPGISGAFLYNPTNPKTGIAIDHEGRLAPVLEDRWREFERAVVRAQAEIDDPREGGGWWSRPQNTTCPTDMTYDLGPGGALRRFHLTGHTVSVRHGYPDDVWWHTPQGETHIRDNVPPPYVEVERIIAALREDLFPPDPPFDWECVPVPIAEELRPMLRAIVRMVGRVNSADRWGMSYPI